MHILHLSEYCTNGGLETHLLCLFQELRRLGHKPYLYTMVISAEFQAQLDQIGINYIVDPAPGQGLLDFITQNKIQILHGHPSQTIPLTARLGQQLNLPTVITYHGLVGWNEESHSILDKIVCISQDVFNRLALKDPTLIPKLTVIQNGIDLYRYRPIDRPRTAKPQKILFAGRLGLDKYVSLKVLIQALEAIPNVELYVAGLGGLNYQLTLESPPWVKYLGWLTDLSGLMNEMNLIVGTGRVIREALACGRPAIALNGYGYDGLVTAENILQTEYDNFAGRSGKALSVTKLLKDLRTILNSPETEQALGQWGREYAGQNYSEGLFAQKHLQLYHSLVHE